MSAARAQSGGGHPQVRMAVMTTTVLPDSLGRASSQAPVFVRNRRVRPATQADGGPTQRLNQIKAL